MDTVNNMNKKIDITPTDSVCPIYRETPDEKQMQKDLANYEKELAEITAKATARQAVLDKLGLTADEAAALFG